MPASIGRTVIVVFSPGADTGGQWVVFCKGPGDNCVVDRHATPNRLGYFVAPSPDGATYDPALAALTEQLNAIVNEANDAERGKGRTLGFYRSPRGLMPIWKTDDGAEPELSAEARSFHVEAMDEAEVERLFWPEDGRAAQ